MRSLAEQDNHLLLQMLVLAALAVAALFFWQGKKGFGCGMKVSFGMVLNGCCLVKYQFVILWPTTQEGTIG